MATDIFDAILAALNNYCLGLVRRVEGAGSTVLGSGVLVQIDGRRGLLTAGHVLETIEEGADIGWLRMAEGTANRRLLDLSDAWKVIFESSDTWTEAGADLGYCLLGAEAAGTMEARGVFLNMESNAVKVNAGQHPTDRHFDVLIGLVAEYSEKPTIIDGEFVSPMRAVAYLGHVVSQENGLYILKLREKDREKLPKSFGGMSGAGLWRVFFNETAEGFEVVDKWLVGIASWENKDGKTITCQGHERLWDKMVPEIKKQFPK